MYPKINVKRTGRRIKQFMKMRQVTVKDVKDYLGLCSVQSVYHWLEGKSLPTIDNLYALSGLLQVSLDDMICGDKEKEGLYARSENRIYSYYKKLKIEVA